MRKYRFLPLLLTLVLLLSVFTLPAAAEETTEDTADSTEVPTEPPLSWQQPASEDPSTAGNLLDYNYAVDFEVSAKAAALIDMGTDTLIYGYELDRQVYPASLTKMMTCLLAVENGNLDDTVTVTASSLENLSIYGSSANLQQGETLSLRELLYCVMVSSANEACNVVAEHISGDVESFVALMNQRAQTLGMTATHFANTHGLHDENHYTTVRDLSILARYAWKNDTFREFASCTEHTVPATNLSDERLLQTTNSLTSTADGNKYYYEKASGIKTGFTTPAGSCLISTAKDGDLELLSIVCGCSNEVLEDGYTYDMRFVETKRLFEFGFNNFAVCQVLTDTTMLGQPTVLYADGRDSVVVRAKGSAGVLLPLDCDPAEVTTELIYDNAQLEAPLEADERVGTVKVMYHGKMIASSDLVTLTAVARAEPTYAAEQPKDTAQEIGGSLLDYWYVTVPLMILAALIILILILRAVNGRKAKKRAEQRRRREARRRRNG